jgi:hypothetical protein
LALDLARVMQTLMRERDTLRDMVRATTPLEGLDDLPALRAYYTSLSKGQEVCAYRERVGKATLVVVCVCVRVCV